MVVLGVALGAATIPDTPARAIFGLIALLGVMPLLVGIGLDRRPTIRGFLVGLLTTLVIEMGIGLAAGQAPLAVRAEAVRAALPLAIAVIGPIAVRRGEHLPPVRFSPARWRPDRAAIAIVAAGIVIACVSLFAMNTPDAQTPYVALSAAMPDGRPFPARTVLPAGTGLSVAVTVTNMTPTRLVAPLAVGLQTQRTLTAIDLAPGASVRTEIGLVVPAGDSEISVTLDAPGTSSQALLLRVTGG
jgi:hypothetical protein